MKKRVFWLFFKNWPNDLADFSLYTVISYGEHDGISRFARKNRLRPQNGLGMSKNAFFSLFLKNGPKVLADFTLYTVILYGEHDGVCHFPRKNRLRLQNGLGMSKNMKKRVF